MSISGRLGGAEDIFDERSSIACVTAGEMTLGKPQSGDKPDVNETRVLETTQPPR